jgi:acetyl-CoA synthetase
MIVSSCGRIEPARAGRIGKAVPGHRVSIVDAAAHAVPAGVAGNIAVQRPDAVMFLRYWSNDEATAGKFVGDWMLTGDLGEMDAEGSIPFISRDDDIITSGGYRIGPGEVEDCLLGHPAVRLAAVIGVLNELRTEIVKAFIVLAVGARVSAANRLRRVPSGDGGRQDHSPRAARLGIIRTAGIRPPCPPRCVD